MFKSRSTEKELIDQDLIPEQDLFQNLKELDFINHWLGGYAISFSAFRRILEPGKSYTLADIGCGGGDTLKRILHWNKKRNIPLDLYGIDIKPACISYAAMNLKGTPIKLITDDYRNLFLHLGHVDIIHASLFCHHLSDAQLVELVRFALEKEVILVINDLERNPLAYYAIQILTLLFSKSYLVKNDAPLSVLRGFRKPEWRRIMQEAGVTNFTLRNKWAFRHEIIVYGREA